MKVVLRIAKKEFDLIASGIKKTEWRQLNKYNKDLLLKDRGDGKKDWNKEITEIEFINGYRKDAQRIIKSISNLRVVKFSQDTNIPEDNFTALAGMFAIEINLI